MRKAWQGNALVKVQARSFIEAFGLKTPLKEADYSARIDAANAYRYHVPQKEGGELVFDEDGRYLVYDAVPAALKAQTTYTLRTYFSLGLLYLAYTLNLGPLPEPLTQQTIYGLTALGSLTGLSIFTKHLSRKKVVSRIFLLRSLEEIRFENAHGDFADVHIKEVLLEQASANVATL